MVGTFGQVLECWDRESKEMVAIKIIRSIKKYMDDARIEIDILQQLGKCETARSRYVPQYMHAYQSLIIFLFVFHGLDAVFCSCVQVRNWFEYRNHICIVSS